MLISEQYRDLNVKQHFEAPEWGRQSMKWWKTVRNLCDHVGVKMFLDYGCGKQMLREALERFGYQVTCYDPAFPETAAPPAPHDFVVCMDVLEHIEPECLDAVLEHLHSLTRKCAFFVVATRPAKTVMPDGTNAHRIVKTKEWWLEKLGRYFTIGEAQAPDENVFAVMVEPKAAP